MFGDTIAAISTAWGEAGISIIRISGPDSRTITKKMVRTLRPLEQIPPRHMRNGFLLDEQGKVIDEVLFVWFSAPRSYTGEDICEVHCHGGSLVAQRCLERMAEGGARLAEPGEFTRRAFLNGRIDLAQAEAVNGIIQAKSNEALRAATRTLRGELSQFASDVYEEVLALASEMEVGMDFPEEDIPYISNEDAQNRLAASRQSLEDLLDRCNSGFLLREGIRIALVGRPNVGKSSLMNALLKESRAIVTCIPGTTRDTIEEVLTYRGVPLRIVDTAGMGKEPSDEVEAIGIERARKAMNDADIRLWVIDGSERLQAPDIVLAAEIADTNHIVAINKADLPQITTEAMISEHLPDSRIFTISAQRGEGLEELKNAIISTVSPEGMLDAGLNATARQIDEIKKAIQAIQYGEEALSLEMGQDVAVSSLTEAREALERLLGISRDDSLLDAIFSRFCVGK